MKVFVSWSGDLSQKLAKFFADWLPLVIQAIDPYFSPDSIEKGARWDTALATQLEVQGVGVFIVTPENSSAPWMCFEAGALSKNHQDGRVNVFLFNMQPGELTGPLSLFQATTFTKDDVLKLVKSLNSLTPTPITDHILTTTFEKFWNDLNDGVTDILDQPPAAEPPKRDEREMLEEVVQRTRQIESRLATGDSLFTHRTIQQPLLGNQSGLSYLDPGLVGDTLTARAKATMFDEPRRPRTGRAPAQDNAADDEANAGG